VNNAGLIRSCPALEMARATGRGHPCQCYRDLLFSQVVGKVMVEQKRGKIINIASNQSEAGVETFAAYGRAKVRLPHSRELWRLNGQIRINVNAVSPAAHGAR